MATLVFPSSMPAALEYAWSARARGERIVAASSVRADDTAAYFDDWQFLPSIYDAGFADALTKLMEHKGITGFYTAHPVVYDHMKRLVSEKGLALALAHQDPLSDMNRQYEKTLELARHDLPYLQALLGAKSLSPLQLAAYLKHAFSIYGQTSESKLLHLPLALAHAPQGDIVEIGAAWGRSAFALQYLARHYGIGPVLAVDAWQAQVAVQHETDIHMQKMIEEYDWDGMFHVFCLNLMPYANGDFNYLRRPSIEAAQDYAASRSITTPEFGEVVYYGKISVLHIDANHDYEAVRADYQAWRPYLAPGGWVLFDDYVWEHGDGPKRLGDEVLFCEAAHIKSAFTAGKTLFLQFH
jgi:hypothetical protein